MIVYTARATFRNSNNIRTVAYCWPNVSAHEFVTVNPVDLGEAVANAHRTFKGEGFEVSVTSEEVDVVLVEGMPTHLRASHKEANNHGVYPVNGSRRFLVRLLVAAPLLDEWTRIVRVAKDDDVGYTLDLDGSLLKGL